MPRRPALPCRQPGCPRLNCELHRPKREDNRPSAAVRGYGRRWQRLRLMYLRAHPLCADPFGVHEAAGETVAATDVDHVTARRFGGEDEWENLQALCHQCHSKKTAKEQRLNDKVKTPVTIVYGPPGAGKTTYVKEHARWGDLIIDFDALYAALSGLDWYEKPAALMPFVASARDAVIDRLHRDSEVRHAWVITSEPDGQKRRALQSRLGARLVFIEVSPQECLRRIAADPRREVKGWEEIVSDWWHNYTPDAG
jgi:5-methylcytosine-specific restriction endonuclease McrA